MNRVGRGGSRGRRSIGPAVLTCWLVAALTALFMCVGSVEHHDATQGPMAQATAVAPAAEANASSHGSMAAMPYDCPAGETCCSLATHHAAAVVSASPQLDPVALPELLCAPRPTGLLVTVAPQTGRAAPDLHVLQVSRT